MKWTWIYFSDIDECIPNPCKNGATCSDQVNGYKCACVAGYTGNTCQSGTLLLRKMQKTIVNMVLRWLKMCTKHL